MSFVFNDTATTEIYTLSLHDALPILFGRHLLSIEKVGGLGRQDFEGLIQSLRRLERFWTDQIRYQL